LRKTDKEQAPASPVSSAMPVSVESAESVPTTHCRHCELVIPPRRRTKGDAFCCEGCKRVFALIHEADLGEFYDMNPARGVPASTRETESFTWLGRFLPDGASGLRRLHLELQGVHCAACVWLLQQLFEGREGAVDLRINSARGTSDIWWNPDEGDLREFLREAARFGYRFGPPTGKKPSATRGLMMRMGLAVAFAMNVMIFSFCFYFGLGPEDGPVFTFVGWLAFALTTGSVVVSGSVFIPSALRALRHGIVHLDLPIALGLILAYLGATLTFRSHGPGHTYFDTVSVFAALMLVGRWVQARVVERNRASVSRSEGTEGLFVRRWRADRPEIVPIGEIECDDRLLVVPGDLIPVRARLLAPAEVESEPALLSLEWISGEPEPLAFAPGAEVPAGARNTGATALDLTAVESFADSGLEELLETSRDESVDAGTGTRWGRVSIIYVSVVLTLSAGAMLFWWGNDPARAFEAAVAILVVTCPCAVGLAVPLAYDLAQVGLRRRGIFIRSGSLLDRARRVRRIYFDKTGTLTSGQLELDPDSRARLGELDDRTRQILASLVLRSNHPRSRSILTALLEDFPDLRPATFAGSVRETSGSGLEGRDGGHQYHLGRPDFALRGATAKFVPAHRTVFSENGRLHASFAFEEELRSDAEVEIEALLSAGYRIRILSGDAAERTRAVARRLGLEDSDAIGGLRPDAKAASIDRDDFVAIPTAVGELPGRSRETMMIGDGLNDVAGFAAAAASGTPAADLPTLPSHVDFCYLGEGITAVRRVLTCAGYLQRVVRDLLIVAAIYNVIVLTLAFLGRLGAIEAAILMPSSSISLVLWTRFRMQRRNPSWKF